MINGQGFAGMSEIDEPLMLTALLFMAVDKITAK